MEIERLDDGTFIHVQSGFILEPMSIGKYRVIGKMENGVIREYRGERYGGSFAARIRHWDWYRDESFREHPRKYKVCAEVVYVRPGSVTC